jgi:acetyl esterase
LRSGAGWATGMPLPAAFRADPPNTRFRMPRSSHRSRSQAAGHGGLRLWGRRAVVIAAMKLAPVALSLVVILGLALPAPLAAADTDARLQELLKRFPEADTNRDGVLTVDEARAHAEKLRAAQRTKRGGAADYDDAGQAQPGSRRPPPTHGDVSYGPHERNTLDLWLAKSNQPTPLVVFIHGGGFVSGSKAGAHAGMITGCLEAGVSFMAINYRFRTTAPIHDVLRDCARAIQFVRANARQYHLDPLRIAAYGGSAGAGTSLWLAFRPDLADPANADPVLRETSRIVAAGAINTQATYHLRRWPEILDQPHGRWEAPGEVAAFHGFTSDDQLTTPDAQPVLADVDMLALISPDDPPVFLYTSHPDGPVASRGHYLHHPNHARAVKRACDAAGVPATLYFAQMEPQLQGDYHRPLRDFLFEHLGVSAAGRDQTVRK